MEVEMGKPEMKEACGRCGSTTWRTVARGRDGWSHCTECVCANCHNRSYQSESVPNCPHTAFGEKVAACEEVHES